MIPFPRERRVQEVRDVFRERGPAVDLGHAIQPGRFQIRDAESRRERERVPLVPFAAAEDRRVDGEAERLVPRLERSLHEFLRDRAVLVHVQLEPPRRIDCARDFFEGLRRDRARDHDRAGGGDASGRRDLALRMDERVERRRGGEDRHRDPLPQDDRPCVAFRDVGQDAGPQRPLVVRLAVPTEGDLVLRASRDVVERRARHFFSSHRLELGEIRERVVHAARDGLQQLMRLFWQLLSFAR